VRQTKTKEGNEGVKLNPLVSRGSRQKGRQTHRRGAKTSHVVKRGEPEEKKEEPDPNKGYWSSPTSATVKTGTRGEEAPNRSSSKILSPKKREPRVRQETDPDKLKHRGDTGVAIGNAKQGRKKIAQASQENAVPSWRKWKKKKEKKPKAEVSVFAKRRVIQGDTEIRQPKRRNKTEQRGKRGREHQNRSPKKKKAKDKQRSQTTLGHLDSRRKLPFKDRLTHPVLPYKKKGTQPPHWNLNRGTVSASASFSQEEKTRSEKTDSKKPRTEEWT